MTKATVDIRSGNAGEISPLMEGRTDWDRYPSSMRKLENFIAAQQGPIIRRSGTVFAGLTSDQAVASKLVPFEFNEEQAQVIEFYPGGLKVHGDTPVVVPWTGFTADNLQSIRTHQSLDVLFIYAKGMQPVTLSRYSATDWRIESRVFVDGPYLDEEPDIALRHVGGTGAVAQNRLRVTGDSRTENTKTFQQTSPHVPVVSGGQPSLSTMAVEISHEAANVLDPSRKEFWESDAVQEGALTIEHLNPGDPDQLFLLEARGYVISLASEGERVLDDNNYVVSEFSALDHAPSSWVFEGRTSGDGVTPETWEELDRQDSYVLYDDNKSIVFPIQSDASYTTFRLRITETVRSGPVRPRIGHFQLIPRGGDFEFDINVRMVDSTSGGVIEHDADGAIDPALDDQRPIRFKASDGLWRAGVVFGSEHQFGGRFTVYLNDGEYPLPSNGANITAWRKGAWSARSGWPTLGLFYDDRCFMGGSPSDPDLVAASVTGDYDRMSPTEQGGEVLADNGLSVRFLSRKLSPMRWMEPNKNGILIGTGSNAWILRKPDTGASIGPLNIAAEPTVDQPSASVDAITVAGQVLYVDRSRRGLRELFYDFDTDDYKSPPLSIFASHIGGRDPFAEVVFAREPHSLVWVRTESGKLAGLTYNIDQKVVGWHRHDIGGEVESMCVLPAEDGRQDVLWLSVRREINGQVRRTIEYLSPFWDFGDDNSDAVFVDSSLRQVYEGDGATVVGNLGHLEGAHVEGLADGVPIPSQQVVNGEIAIADPAREVVVGLPYTSSAETSRVNAGARDGTAQGKEKRPHNAIVSLWDTREGEVGTYNENEDKIDWVAIPYNEAPYSRLEASNKLVTGFVGPFPLDPGYAKQGILAFQQTRPLPFNLVSLIVQLYTQDR